MSATDPLIHVMFDPEVFIQQRWGGISRYFSELMPRLATAPGLDVSVCAGLHINRYPLGPRSSGFRHVIAWRPPFHVPYRLTKPINRLVFGSAAGACRPDIYHMTSYEPYPAPRSCRRVLTFHDATPLKYGAMPRPSLRPTRDAMAQVDGIICISHNTLDDLHELLGPITCPTAVVYHGSSFRYDPDLPRPIEPPYFLHVGQLGGYKNFELLLEAFATSRARHTARLICFGVRSLDRFVDRITEYGLEAEVLSMVGDDRMLAACYQHALALVYPSRYEGFGIPLVEAMSLRCPVLAADASCFPEIVSEGGDLFSPDEPEQLASMLDEILDNTQYREDLRRRATARGAFFTWERCASETAAFYRRLMA